MDDRFDKLIGDLGRIAGLHSFVHIFESLSTAVYQQVVAHLNALPAFVAVHSIETTDDRGYLAGRLGTVGLELVDEADTRTRVGIAAVHETVDKRVALQLVFGGDVAEVEEVVEAGVDTTIGGQTHEMDVLAVLLGIGEDGFDLRIVQDTAVFAGTIDLYEVLIDHSSGTDIEVSYFGVTHLSVGQTYVLAAGLQLRVRIGSQQFVPVGRRRAMDGIGRVLVANAPSVQNH